MAIQAITFDFWCTLFRDADGLARRQLRAEALTRMTGVSTERAFDALEAAARDFMRAHIEEQRNLTPMDAVRISTAALDVTVSPEEAHELAEVFGTAILHHSPVPIDDALEAVQAASQHRPLGIISDSGLSPGTSLRVLLDRHGFTPYFVVTTFSDEVGVSKPQAPMFERTADALGVTPSELLHIGDLEPTDIAGAQALGAKAVLFAGDNDRHLADTQADYVFRSWRAFMDALPTILDEG